MPFKKMNLGTVIAILVLFLCVVAFAFNLAVGAFVIAMIAALALAIILSGVPVSRG